VLKSPMLQGRMTRDKRQSGLFLLLYPNLPAGWSAFPQSYSA
jgi:hypothetical protein